MGRANKTTAMHFVIFVEFRMMTVGWWAIVFIMSSVLSGVAQSSSAVPQKHADSKRSLVVMPNLAEQLRVHFNVSAADLARTFSARQREAHVVLRQILEDYELTHITTGVTVYFGGFSTVGADELVCSEHSKPLSVEYYEAGEPLTYPALKCVIFQEVSCVMFERARRTFYLPLEKVKLTRKFYASEGEADAIKACQDITSIHSVNIKGLIARRAKATVSPPTPTLVASLLLSENAYSVNLL